MSRRTATRKSQPRGFVRNTFHGPLRRGRDQGLLDRVLRHGEVVVTPCDCAKHLWGEVAQQVLYRVAWFRIEVHPK